MTGTNKTSLPTCRPTRKSIKLNYLRYINATLARKWLSIVIDTLRNTDIDLTQLNSLRHIIGRGNDRNWLNIIINMWPYKDIDSTQ